ncbi:MAG TPA: type II toxin-antitoxin system VapC family toxin [Longimicrobiaceae bacterium]|nr:type II toxin-antitoxin system VapC family toxin [Longimicrobiaceae bacterium]
MKEITGRPKRWGGLFVSSFVEIEVVSAIAKEAREYGNPMLRPQLLREVPQRVDGFLRDYASGAFDVIPQSDEIVRAGIGTLRNEPHHQIGAADAIHLASAVDVALKPNQKLVFVTADRGLYDAAREHGLAVYNPNTQHEAALEAMVGL